MLLLLVIQAGTGLMLAGTDLFWPPFGSWFAGWVAATGVDPASVSPLAANTIDRAAYDSMRAFRRPLVTIHLYTFFVLSGVIVLHLAAVVVTELREGGSITSAMFTGRKLLDRPPQDQLPRRL
jgi:cytochrome b